MAAPIAVESTTSASREGWRRNAPRRTRKSIEEPKGAEATIHRSLRSRKNLLQIQARDLSADIMDEALVLPKARCRDVEH